MEEPGVPTARDEALAIRLMLMGLHVDDDMGYAAMDEIFAGVAQTKPGGKQRVVNVLEVLAGHAINLAVMQVGRDRVIASFTSLLAEKTLEAMNDKEN